MKETGLYRSQIFLQDEAICIFKKNGRKFVNLFHNIYVVGSKTPGISRCKLVLKWIMSMESLLHHVLKIQLDYKKERLSNTQLFDWFLTCGFDMEILFRNKSERNTYERFTKELLESKDVRKSLLRAGLY